MEKLSAAGVNVTCRWQPYIPGVSEAPEEFVPRIARTGCRHLGFEHLKLPLERRNPLWSEFIGGVDRDLFHEYKSRGAVRDGREMVLPAGEKLKLILDARREVHRYGMSFGAADNEFQFLSDTGCCCSGADRFAGFENWFRHQIGFAVRQSIGSRITYQSIEAEWAPAGSIDRHLNSHSRLSQRTGSMGSVREHVRSRWNSPRAAGSPAAFFGVSAIQPAPDDDADVVYEWNESGRQLLAVSGALH
jgi:hypothetical protein